MAYMNQPCWVPKAWKSWTAPPKVNGHAQWLEMSFIF